MPPLLLFLLFFVSSVLCQCGQYDGRCSACVSATVATVDEETQCGFCAGHEESGNICLSLSGTNGAACSTAGGSWLEAELDADAATISLLCEGLNEGPATEEDEGLQLPMIIALAVVGCILCCVFYAHAIKFTIGHYPRRLRDFGAPFSSANLGTSTRLPPQSERRRAPERARHQEPPAKAPAAAAPVVDDVMGEVPSPADLAKMKSGTSSRRRKKTDRAASPPPASASPEAVAALEDLGFVGAEARRALVSTGNNVDAAVELLMSASGWSDTVHGKLPVNDSVSLYYRAGWDRATATEHLQDVGTSGDFVLRPSSAGDTAIAVSYLPSSGTISHCVIRKTDANTYIFDAKSVETKEHPSLPHCLAAHKIYYGELPEV